MFANPLFAALLPVAWSTLAAAGASGACLSSQADHMCDLAAPIALLVEDLASPL